MHYIIGAEFSIPAKVHGKTDPRSLELNRLCSLFKAPGHYIVYYISKVRGKNKVQYTFQHEHGELIRMEFNTATEADQMISKAKGENLPDYEDYYSKLES